MKHVFVIILMLFFFTSCKKDKLIGEKEIFIGKWNWVYSIDKDYLYDTTHIYYPITPSTENVNYSIEFKENGKYYLRKNSDVFYKDKAKFLQWEPNASGTRYYFTLFIDDETQLVGKVYGDTIVTSDYFPPFELEYGAYKYYNYFAKE
jgi:hypothetical protein